MSGECEKENISLRDMLSQVVESFVFPDGCLDLGRDDQDAFIDTLEEKINEWIRNQHVR